MATAKLNIQHDYLTLRITWSKQTKMNLTTARYSEKASGSQDLAAQLEPALRAFSATRKLVKQDGGRFATIKDWMEHLQALATAAETPDAFVGALQGLAKEAA